MQAGRVIEIGAPQDLYTRPKTRFAAAFLGDISYLTGRVAGGLDGDLVINTPSGSLRCRHAASIAAGTVVVAGVRPEHVILSTQRPQAWPNVFEGTVASAQYEGGRVKYRLAMDGVDLLAYGPPVFSPGDRLHAVIDPAQVILLPDPPAEASSAARTSQGNSAGGIANWPTEGAIILPSDDGRKSAIHQ